MSLIATAAILVMLILGIGWIAVVIDASAEEMEKICEDAGGEPTFYEIFSQPSCFIDGKVREIVKLKDDGWRIEK